MVVTITICTRVSIPHSGLRTSFCSFDLSKGRKKGSPSHTVGLELTFYSHDFAIIEAPVSIPHSGLRTRLPPQVVGVKPPSPSHTVGLKHLRKLKFPASKTRLHPTQWA